MREPCHCCSSGNATRACFTCDPSGLQPVHMCSACSERAHFGPMKFSHHVKSLTNMKTKKVLADTCEEWAKQEKDRVDMCIKELGGCINDLENQKRTDLEIMAASFEPLKNAVINRKRELMSQIVAHYDSLKPSLAQTVAACTAHLNIIDEMHSFQSSSIKDMLPVLGDGHQVTFPDGWDIDAALTSIGQCQLKTTPTVLTDEIVTSMTLTSGDVMDVFSNQMDKDGVFWLKLCVDPEITVPLYQLAFGCRKRLMLGEVKRFSEHPEDLHTGMVVMLDHPEDGVWCRAIITDPCVNDRENKYGGFLASVVVADSGYKVEVPLSRLASCSEDDIKMPFLAVPCSLYPEDNHPPLGLETKWLYNDRIKDEKGRPRKFTATFVHKKTAQHVVVSLWYIELTDDKGVSLNKLVEAERLKNEKGRKVNKNKDIRVIRGELAKPKVESSIINNKSSDATKPVVAQPGPEGDGANVLNIKPLDASPKKPSCMLESAPSATSPPSDLAQSADVTSSTAVDSNQESQQQLSAPAERTSPHSPGDEASHSHSKDCSTPPPQITDVSSSGIQDHKHTDSPPATQSGFDSNDTQGSRAVYFPPTPTVESGLAITCEALEKSHLSDLNETQSVDDAVPAMQTQEVEESQGPVVDAADTHGAVIAPSNAMQHAPEGADTGGTPERTENVNLAPKVYEHSPQCVDETEHLCKLADMEYLKLMATEGEDPEPTVVTGTGGEATSQSDATTGNEVMTHPLVAAEENPGAKLDTRSADMHEAHAGESPFTPVSPAAGVTGDKVSGEDNSITNPSGTGVRERCGSPSDSTTPEDLSLTGSDLLVRSTSSDAPPKTNIRKNSKKKLRKKKSGPQKSDSRSDDGQRQSASRTLVQSPVQPIDGSQALRTSSPVTVDTESCDGPVKGPAVEVSMSDPAVALSPKTRNFKIAGQSAIRSWISAPARAVSGLPSLVGDTAGPSTSTAISSLLGNLAITSASAASDESVRTRPLSAVLSSNGGKPSSESEPKLCNGSAAGSAMECAGAAVASDVDSAVGAAADSAAEMETGACDQASESSTTMTTASAPGAVQSASMPQAVEFDDSAWEECDTDSTTRSSQSHTQKNSREPSQHRRQGCFHCGNSSHMKRGCPKRVVSRRGGSSCFVCSETRHKSEDCPRARAAYHAGGCPYCLSLNHRYNDSFKRCRPRVEIKFAFAAHVKTKSYKKPDRSGRYGDRHSD